MESYLFEGNISVKAAILGGVRSVHEVIVDKNKKDRDTLWILHRAQERSIPIRFCERAQIDALARDKGLLQEQVRLLQNRVDHTGDIFG